MMPQNISKELDWLLARKMNKLKETNDKGQIYKIDAEYDYARNVVLMKMGITYLDASV